MTTRPASSTSKTTRTTPSKNPGIPTRNATARTRNPSPSRHVHLARSSVPRTCGGSGGAGVGGFGVDLVGPDRLRDDLTLDVAELGQPVERRDHEVGRVDLEVPPERV